MPRCPLQPKTHVFGYVPLAAPSSIQNLLIRVPSSWKPLFLPPLSSKGRNANFPDEPKIGALGRRGETLTRSATKKPGGAWAPPGFG